MRIIITDTGYIWNHENPYLAQFKDIVLVVCLNGKKATDQYQCFVSPYQAGTGREESDAEDARLQALSSVAEKLNSELGYHDNIIFLTDNNPSTLYPYHLLKGIVQYNCMHLIAMPPWSFEGNKKIAAYNRMISDLTPLDSILYYDSRHVLSALGQQSTMSDAICYARDYLGGLMPKFMNGIYEMKSRPCFFDFASMAYVPLESGFEKINLRKNLKNRKAENEIKEEIKFPVTRRFATLGVVRPSSYPQDTDRVKEEVERLSVRLDGKKVCNILREQRIRMAEANHIPFQSDECPSIGPCAGTCEKCDMESKYLRKQLQKIPENQRVYPKFDPAEEMPSCGADTYNLTNKMQSCNADTYNLTNRALSCDADIFNPANQVPSCETDAFDQAKEVLP